MLTEDEDGALIMSHSTLGLFSVCVCVLDGNKITHLCGEGRFSHSPLLQRLYMIIACTIILHSVLATNIVGAPI
jgi:hypothetical protein